MKSLNKYWEATKESNILLLVKMRHTENQITLLLKKEGRKQFHWQQWSHQKILRNNINKGSKSLLKKITVERNDTRTKEKDTLCTRKETFYITNTVARGLPTGAGAELLAKATVFESGPWIATPGKLKWNRSNWALMGQKRSLVSLITV